MNFFVASMKHKGLYEYKTFKKSDESILKHLVQNQIILWERKWEQKIEQEKKYASKELAKSLTDNALSALQETEDILQYTLTVDDTINWETIKEFDTF
jgi:hypothetical protein